MHTVSPLLFISKNWMVLILGLVFAGCQKQAPPHVAVPDEYHLGEQDAVISAEILKIPVDDLRKLDLVLPGSDTSVPPWVGTRSTEPFDVKAFLKERVPFEGNAAPIYLLACDAVTPFFVYLYPPEKQKEVFENRKVLMEQRENYSNLDLMFEGGYPLEELEILLQQTTPAIAMLDFAQTKPKCIFITGQSVQSLIPHAQSQRTFARLAATEIYVAIKKHDFDDAFAAARRIFRMVKDFRPYGFVIGELVGVACENIVLKALATSVLADDQLTSEQCDQIIKLLLESSTDCRDRLRNALKMEYVMFGNVIEDDAATHLIIPVMKLSATESEPLASHRVNLPLERRTLDRRYSLAFAELDRPVHELIQDLAHSSLSKDVETSSSRFRRGSDYFPWKYSEPVIMNILTPGILLNLPNFAESDALMGATLCLTAIRRYQIVHGHLPETIGEAIKEAGIFEAPLDPFSGQPFLYLIRDGMPVVYSIGPDQKDDGGRDVPKPDRDRDVVVTFKPIQKAE
ncbi:hypothetical protein SH668x_002988 [Planctomicrobium sp. SH668]|uniref:hypothetical protein n=1 Tax=Planctomicrobium sp. SH668 TaxID=3448126 RepID=UPI003F5C6B43